jgi:hypothetical protein
MQSLPNVSSYSDNCREQMEEPLLSSAEVAASASSSSAAKSSAEKPRDICAGAFGPNKEVIGLLLCICSRDGILSERRGDVCIDCSVIGQTPRRVNWPENGPSLCEVI